MLSLLRALRQSLRALRRQPLHSAAVLLTLGLGTGASIAIFSAVESTLLAPLPYGEADRLVQVWWASPRSDSIPASLADLHDWRAASRSFEVLAAFHPWTFTLTGSGEAERVPSAVVTAELFLLLGTAPRLGGGFAVDGPEAVPAVVLSDAFWKRRLGGDPGIVGESLTLDGELCAVVGVLPAGFSFPLSNPAELFKVNTFGPGDFPRDVRYLQVLGRLQEGVSRERAQAEMEGIAARLAEAYPDTTAGLGARVVPLYEAVVEGFRQALLFLQLAVLLALAIACFNVAVLQLARISGRWQEISVRMALGATRGQVFRHFLAENLLLAAAGGALGLLLAAWGVRLLVRFGPASIPRLGEAAVDPAVLAFAVAITAGAGLLFGTAPALVSTRRELGPALQASGRMTPRAAGWLRNVFVLLQVAITLALLVGAGLLIRSFASLSSVAPGFRTADLLTLQVTLPESLASLEQTSAFYQELKQRVETLPGVESFATAVSLPLAGGMRVDNAFEIEGRPWDGSGEEPTAEIRPVSPGFFRTLGIPVIAGRTFGEEERGGSPAVAVINQEMARLFFPGEDPLGQRLKTTLDFGPAVGRLEGESWEIVGVVGDIRHRSLAEGVQPEIYFSTLQSPWMVINLAVRTSLDAAALARPVSAEIQAMAPDLPVVKVRTMEDLVAGSLRQPRFNTWLVSVFAAFALILTGVGLYGVLSYSVAMRSREIGLRMALGARPRELVGRVVLRGMLVTLAGLAAGAWGALALGRALAGLLHGTQPTDPATFATVSLALLLVAFAASFLPARRAARVNPTESLRKD